MHRVFTVRSNSTSRLGQVCSRETVHTCNCPTKHIDCPVFDVEREPASDAIRSTDILRRSLVHVIFQASGPGVSLREVYDPFPQLTLLKTFTHWLWVFRQLGLGILQQLPTARV